jgi:hypothetical protein
MWTGLRSSVSMLLPSSRLKVLPVIRSENLDLLRNGQLGVVADV